MSYEMKANRLKKSLRLVDRIGFVSKKDKITRIYFDAATGRALKPWLIEPVERLDSCTKITPIHRGLKGGHV